MFPAASSSAIIWLLNVVNCHFSITSYDIRWDFNSSPSRYGIHIDLCLPRITLLTFEEPGHLATSPLLSIYLLLRRYATLIHLTWNDLHCAADFKPQKFVAKGYLVLIPKPDNYFLAHQTSGSDHGKFDLAFRLPLWCREICTIYHERLASYRADCQQEIEAATQVKVEHVCFILPGNYGCFNCLLFEDL